MVATVILAALMAWCAVPAVIGELIVLPHDAAIDRARDGRPVPPAALAAAARAQIRAAGWDARDRHLTDAAVAMIAQGPRGADRAAVQAVLTDALQARPRDRRNWLRLATVRLPADRAGARAAWSMAVRTAPFDPPAASAILATGFALLPSNDSAFVAALTRQVRAAALADADGMAAAALAGGAVPFVRAGLLAEPDLDWRFSIALTNAVRTDRRDPR